MQSGIFAANTQLASVTRLSDCREAKDVPGGGGVDSTSQQDFNR